jgi:hypothetical protein
LLNVRFAPNSGRPANGTKVAFSAKPISIAMAVFGHQLLLGESSISLAAWIARWPAAARCNAKTL